MKTIVIVLDSVGVGALPDAANFGDVGAHTLNHIREKTGLELPNLCALGLSQIEGVNFGKVKASGAFGRMLEQSKGKDTSTGHWEFMGVILAHPFKTFVNFPPAVIDEFTKRTGQNWLCNEPYSGTEVIKDFGEKHRQTGWPIIYTSADSVFQIAAHVDVVPLETLYEWCKIAREILQGEFAVARVIARPFDGEFPFNRLNEARKDFSLEPPKNVLDALFSAGKQVIGIGKIPDIYANRGFTEEIHTDNNLDGIEKILKVMKRDFDGLAFANLVDFDAKFGHRRDVAGYAKSLAEFDERLPEILSLLDENSALFIVSDHGNDPTWHGTDHTREYGMLLAKYAGAENTNLGERQSFADLGATIAQALGVSWSGPGTSFWPELQQ